MLSNYTTISVPGKGIVVQSLHKLHKGNTFDFYSLTIETKGGCTMAKILVADDEQKIREFSSKQA